MIEKRFLQGLVAALLSLGLVVGALQLLMARAGEVGLAGVVDRQLAAPNGEVLFLSGINQNAYRYKEMLFDRTRPAAIAIGSSRALEVRSEFFNTSFLSMGGSVINLATLESVADHVAAAPARPALAMVFVDPWLFNARYTDNQAPTPTYPSVVSADLLWFGLKSLRQGNWIAHAFQSPNLGIHALLREEGFARDGSQYYDLTGAGQSYDLGFKTTFARIEGDRQNFQHGTRADPALVARICTAIGKIGRAAGHTVVVAPPFAGAIWKRLSQSDYGYIADGYRQLRACAGDAPFFDFTDPSRIPDSTDCEFVDGLHGGDVTYARMLRQVAAADPAARAYLRTDFLDRFVRTYAGHAGGANLLHNPGLREVDFLGLGCRK
jgi:hypothetical protein